MLYIVKNITLLVLMLSAVASAATVEKVDDTIYYEENITFSQKDWEFGLAPAMIFEGREGDYLTDEIFGVGFHIGYRFADHWLAFFDFDYMNDDIQYNGNPTTVSIRDQILGVAYELKPYNTRWTPYATLGYDYRMISVVPGRDNSCITIGAGLKYRVSYHFMVNLDMKGRWNLDIDEKGLIFYLGANFMVDSDETEKARAKQYIVQNAYQPVAPTTEITVVNECCDNDQDKDGVLDKYDECPNTPEGTQVDKYGCPMVMNLHINFDKDKWKIKEEYMPKMDQYAEWMLSHPAYNAVIVGHTDSHVGRIDNQTLSDNRAKAVKEALVARGVAEERITTSGMGPARPVATNKTEEGRALNRRIEAHLYR